MNPCEMLKEKIGHIVPRLPLEGNIDLTYRCNNNCRHCWIVVPDTNEEHCRELTTEEWFNIIDQARSMGTREWAISGGEPLLREDFTDIFNHITQKTKYYTLNTNGTLINPSIAKVLKKEGIVLVSLYGATADVHNHITRNPGSFDAALRGIAYLKEAGVHFMVQIVPMKDNFHQWSEMKKLAKNLSPIWRIGAAYLILSASGDEKKNKEIRAQRLNPKQLIEIDPPNIPYEERARRESSSNLQSNQRKYSNCLSNRSSFHIDPSGSMSFCCYIKEEGLRYDLKKGSFVEGWESFIPSLAEKDWDCLVFNNKCRTCELKSECQRCPALSYLEHRRTNSPSSYLCRFTTEGHKYRQNWKTKHQKYFQIAGITIEVNSEREIKDNTFSPSLQNFVIDKPGDDVIQFEIYFSLPELNEKLLGKLVYEKQPWMIYNRGDIWYYISCIENDKNKTIHRIAEFTHGYSRGRIFLESDYRFHLGNLNSVAVFPTDQVWLAQPLLLRQAFYIHSSGMIVNGNGLIFVGHSQAGKSTIAKLFADQAELLCDDRNILRYWPNKGWKVHGTWSHGELPQVSPSSAPLKGIFFLEKSRENALIRIHDRMEIRKRIIPCLPRPYVDLKWWEGIWPLVSKIAAEIPTYITHFDKSGTIVPMIKELNQNKHSKKMPKDESGFPK